MDWEILSPIRKGDVVVVRMKVLHVSNDEGGLVDLALNKEQILFRVDPKYVVPIMWENDNKRGRKRVVK